MSNTPRTDSMRGFHGLDTAVDAEFSEQLECELAVARQRIKRLEELVQGSFDQFVSMLGERVDVE